MNFINKKFHEEYYKERKEKYQEIKKIKEHISEMSHTFQKSGNI